MAARKSKSKAAKGNPVRLASTAINLAIAAGASGDDLGILIENALASIAGAIAVTALATLAHEADGNTDAARELTHAISAMSDANTALVHATVHFAKVFTPEDGADVEPSPRTPVTSSTVQ